MSILNKLKEKSREYTEQVQCPVNKHTVFCYPLTAKDELALKTLNKSIDLIYVHIGELIYRNVEFIDENDKRLSFSFSDFCKFISIYDLHILMWGILKTTYNDKWGKFENDIVCPSCENKFPWINEVTYSELLPPIGTSFEELEEEFYKEFDKVDEEGQPIPFDLYFSSATLTDIFKDYKIDINYKIPTLMDNINTLKCFTDNEVRESVIVSTNTSGDLFMPFMKLISFIDAIVIEDLTNPTSTSNKEILKNKSDIRAFIGGFLPLEKTNKLIELYNNEFDVYRPKFKKGFKCDKCLHEWDKEIPIEIEFFRKPFE